jgi:hypothetical protein
MLKITGINLHNNREFFNHLIYYEPYMKEAYYIANMKTAIT